MSDMTIDCADCTAPFQFSEAEQEFYKEKSLSNPKRCQSCRTKRRRDRESGQAKEYHETTCHKCGNTCTVPFVPREGKPVYCHPCFKTIQGAA